MQNDRHYNKEDLQPPRAADAPRAAEAPVASEAERAGDAPPASDTPAAHGKRSVLRRVWNVFTTVLVAIVVLFALLLRAWQADSQTITVINQVLKLLAILAGVWVAVGRGGERGALRGACIGLGYMGLGVALYGLLSGQQLSLAGYAADVGMGIAAGGLCGMILSNLPAK